MPTLSDDQLNALWRAGVPLQSAWEAYAAPDARARWEAIKGNSFLQAFVSGLEAISESDMGAGEKFQASLAPVASMASEQNEVRGAMRDALSGYIREGHLFGFGFEPPRKLASVPVGVPQQIWQGRIEWDKSTVELGSLRFIEVRLITRQARNVILERPSPVARESVPTRGRPAVGPHIEAACKALIAEGRIDPSRSAKSHFDLIRERLDQVGQVLPVPAGAISDEAIRLHFAPHFKALKAAKKQ